MTRKFGWLKDDYDPRDFRYRVPKGIVDNLPNAVDLRPNCPPVYDQGRIGSCTANAIAGAVQFNRLKAHEQNDFIPSRLFIYYNEREMEGTIPEDSGAQIRDGIKSIANLGVCDEAIWPYDDTPADETTGLFPVGSKPICKPSSASYAMGTEYQALQYHRVAQTLSDLKACLAEGFPFVFGFSVYASLYDERGVPRIRVPMPSPHDALLGGHAVVCVGYDDTTELFTIRNSWGAANQEAGYFYLPYAYVTDSTLANDFWTVRKIED